jgi:hypothetical protein
MKNTVDNVCRSAIAKAHKSGHWLNIAGRGAALYPLLSQAALL